MTLTMSKTMPVTRLQVVLTWTGDLETLAMRSCLLIQLLLNCVGLLADLLNEGMVAIRRLEKTSMFCVDDVIEEYKAAATYKGAAWQLLTGISAWFQDSWQQMVCSPASIRSFNCHLSASHLRFNLVQQIWHRRQIATCSSSIRGHRFWIALAGRKDRMLTSRWRTLATLKTYLTSQFVQLCFPDASLFQ